MKIAVIGSRNITKVDLQLYLPPTVTELISGGAKGVDRCAKEYALAHQLPFCEILPNYRRYGKAAPLKRNLEIIARADFVLAFWNGTSHGTAYVIAQCQKQKVPYRVIRLSERELDL